MLAEQSERIKKKKEKWKARIETDIGAVETKFEQRFRLRVGVAHTAGREEKKK